MAEADHVVLQARDQFLETIETPIHGIETPIDLNEARLQGLQILLGGKLF